MNIKNLICELHSIHKKDVSYHNNMYVSAKCEKNRQEFYFVINKRAPSKTLSDQIVKKNTQNIVRMLFRWVQYFFTKFLFDKK